MTTQSQMGNLKGTFDSFAKRYQYLHRFIGEGGDHYARRSAKQLKETKCKLKLPDADVLALARRFEYVGRMVRATTRQPDSILAHALNCRDKAWKL